ncbi:hypothetical protein [Rickettsia monacensis]|uniref:hypothetical protein n=1 Tax=Rickettsia monacensis TaxID=109232 RepID=UPI00155AADF8|nr:hypothetical protein [Rickettsia monacensis]
MFFFKLTFPMSFPLGIVTWINFTSVMPWLDHGIQILKLLVFFIVFLDAVDKHTA